MPVAALIVPLFALRISLLDQPELDGLPLVLTSPPNSRTVVTDCTPEAALQGVRPGMLLREVTALCPDAIFIEPNPVRESTVFDDILRTLETFSPSLEAGPSGCCYVDLHGLQRHDASPEAGAVRLLQLIPPVLRPRAGIAPGKFTALCAARKSHPGNTLLIAPDVVTAFLADLPTSWLPVDPKTIARLERLGLRSMGEIAALPMTAMQARFGKDGRRSWELASGRDDLTVVPLERPETVIEAITLPAPSTSRDMLLLGIRQLVQRAFRRPEMQHRNVRQAQLHVLIEDNRSWEKSLTFRDPAGAERIMEIVSHRLQDLELQGAAERIVLHLIGLVSETTRQQLLPFLKPKQIAPIGQAIRQLKQRYGDSPLYRVVEIEPWSRIPERRYALIEYDP
ncbi:MAG: DNA polymerase Y family protein [Thermomicrobiales bacterium]|nr:MAG: DNA polymerase Y family protein [Thermomicrobiales bacterium]